MEKNSPQLERRRIAECWRVCCVQLIWRGEETKTVWPHQSPRSWCCLKRRKILEKWCYLSSDRVTKMTINIVMLLDLSAEILGIFEVWDPRPRVTVNETNCLQMTYRYIFTLRHSCEGSTRITGLCCSYYHRSPRWQPYLFVERMF